MVTRKAQINLNDVIDLDGRLYRGVTGYDGQRVRAVLAHRGWVRWYGIGALVRAHWAKKNGARYVTESSSSGVEVSSEGNR